MAEREQRPGARSDAGPLPDLERLDNVELQWLLRAVAAELRSRGWKVATAAAAPGYPPGPAFRCPWPR